MLDDKYLKALKDNPALYLKTLCKIKTKEQTIEPFIANKLQEDLFKKLDEHRRIIILKSRQMGCSVGVCGYLYHKTITTPATNTVIIGYKRDEAAYLLGVIKFLWETTPKEFRPEIKYNTKYELSFPRVNSTITVLPSTATAGRGRTINYLHVTELAFWDNPEETFTGLSESVPKKGKIIVESTPNGVGSLYHKMWTNKDNGYYKLKYTYDWMYSDKEMEEKKKEIGDRRFSQEYSCNFLTSGRTVFDTDVIEKHRDNVIQASKCEITSDKFRIYKRPEKDHKYVVAADPSSGIAGGDYSVVVIFDKITGEEVAFFRGRIPPDILGGKVNIWGRMYYNAFCVVEENNHGIAVLNSLKAKAYPNLYFRRTIGDREDKVTQAMGWKTGPRTKPLMIDDLSKMLRDSTDGLIIHSEEIIEELLIYELKENGSTSAPRGYHDDSVMALALAVQGMKLIPVRKLTQIDESKHVVL